jgi:hypothetical protein
MIASGALCAANSTNLLVMQQAAMIHRREWRAGQTAIGCNRRQPNCYHVMRRTGWQSTFSGVVAEDLRQ